MKRILNSNSSAIFALLGGMLGCALRIWLYATQVDTRGFLIQGSLPELLSLLLSAAVLGLLLVALRRCPRKVSYERAFAPFLPGTISCGAAAAGIAVSLLGSAALTRDILGIITSVIGWLSVVSLCVLAWYRAVGKRPVFLLPCILTLYFMLYLISQYRYWSASPRTQDYLFLLLALLFLMLATFHHTALTVDSGSYRSYLFFSRSALYFCCLALFSADMNAYLFYLTMAMWLLADSGQVGERR